MNVILTDREKQVLLLIVQDMNGNEITAALLISAKTVDFHKLNIRRKLNVIGPSGMLRYALKAGIVEL